MIDLFNNVVTVWHHLLRSVHKTIYLCHCVCTVRKLLPTVQCYFDHGSMSDAEIDLANAKIDPDIFRLLKCLLIIRR
jgi:hypothetical protein